MKVHSLVSSNAIVRGLMVASLTWALAAGGAVAPATASAEAAPVALPPVAVSVALAALTAPSMAATPVVPVAKPVVRKVAAKKLSVRATIAKTGRTAKLSGKQVSALLWIAKRESNFHVSSVSSGGCYGLFQLARSMVHGHPWRSATWNTKRAIKYMKGRYGGVMQAKAFWQRHHWY